MGSAPCGTERFAQYSDHVARSPRHHAFNTTVNYTLFFLVRENVGSALLFVLPSCRSSSGSARKQNTGWMYGDGSANKMPGQNSRDRGLFLAEESAVIACV